MVCGMIVNILIARFTNLKYIFLTGHHTFYMAAFLAIILTVSHIKGWLTICYRRTRIRINHGSLTCTTPTYDA